MSWKEDSINFIFGTIYSYLPNSTKKCIQTYINTSVQMIVKFAKEDIESNKKYLRIIALFLFGIMVLFAYFSYYKGFIISGSLLLTSALTIGSISYLENLKENLINDFNKAASYFYYLMPVVFIGLFIYRYTFYNLDSHNSDLFFQALAYTISCLAIILLAKLLLLVLIPLCLLYLVKMILRKVCESKIARGIVTAYISSYICNKISSNI